MLRANNYARSWCVIGKSLLGLCGCQLESAHQAIDVRLSFSFGPDRRRILHSEAELSLHRHCGDGDARGRYRLRGAKVYPDSVSDTYVAVRRGMGVHAHVGDQ